MTVTAELPAMVDPCDSPAVWVTAYVIVVRSWTVVDGAGDAVPTALVEIDDAAVTIAGLLETWAAQIPWK